MDSRFKVQPFESRRAAATECAVIGGGILGCAMFYEMSAAGVDAILIEQGRLGTGVSGSSLAAITAHSVGSIDELPYVLGSCKMWADLDRELNGSFEYARAGQIRLAPTEASFADLEAIVAEESTAGVNVSLIDAGQLRSLLPALGPTVRGASFAPDDAKINPLLALGQLAKAGIRRGGEVICQTRVVRLEDGKRGVNIHTNRGTLSARWVIVCAGPWTPSLTEAAGVTLPIAPKPAACAITEALPPLIAPIVSTVAHGVDVGYTQLHQVQSGQVLFNTVVETTPETPDHHRSADVDYHFLVASARTLGALFPGLRTARLLRSWSAMEAWTPDHRFLVGRLPRMEGVLVAAGDSGTGFLRAPLLARLVRELLCDGRPSLSLDRYDPSRFQTHEVA